MCLQPGLPPLNNERVEAQTVGLGEVLEVETFGRAKDLQVTYVYMYIGIY